MATPLKILTRGPCVQQAVLASPRALSALSPKLSQSLSMAVSSSMRTAMSMTGGSPLGSLAGSPRCFPAAEDHHHHPAFFVEASGSAFSPCPSPKGSDQAKLDDLAKWCRDQTSEATASEAFPLAPQNARKSFLARRAQRLAEAAESEQLSAAAASSSSEVGPAPALLLGTATAAARPRVSFSQFPAPQSSLLGRRCFFEAPCMTTPQRPATRTTATTTTTTTTTTTRGEKRRGTIATGLDGGTHLCASLRLREGRTALCDQRLPVFPYTHSLCPKPAGRCWESERAMQQT